MFWSTNDWSSTWLCCAEMTSLKLFPNRELHVLNFIFYVRACRMTRGDCMYVCSCVCKAFWFNNHLFSWKRYMVSFINKYYMHYGECSMCNRYSGDSSATPLWPRVHQIHIWVNSSFLYLKRFKYESIQIETNATLHTLCNKFCFFIVMCKFNMFDLALTLAACSVICLWILKPLLNLLSI